MAVRESKDTIRRQETVERIKTFMLVRYGKEDYCPLLENLEEVYRIDSELTAHERVDVRFRVAEFMYPKFKAVEMKVDADAEVRGALIDKLVKMLG